jgi:hypothetical protein
MQGKRHLVGKEPQFDLSYQLELPARKYKKKGGIVPDDLEAATGFGVYNYFYEWELVKEQAAHLAGVAQEKDEVRQNEVESHCGLLTAPRDAQKEPLTNAVDLYRPKSTSAAGAQAKRPTNGTSGLLATAKKPLAVTVTAPTVAENARSSASSSSSSSSGLVSERTQNPLTDDSEDFMPLDLRRCLVHCSSWYGEPNKLIAQGILHCENAICGKYA